MLSVQKGIRKIHSQDDLPVPPGSAFIRAAALEGRKGKNSEVERADPHFPSLTWPEEWEMSGWKGFSPRFQPVPRALAWKNSHMNIPHTLGLISCPPVSHQEPVKLGWGIKPALQTAPQPCCEDLLEMRTPLVTVLAAVLCVEQGEPLRRGLQGRWGQFPTWQNFRELSPTL